MNLWTTSKPVTTHPVSLRITSSFSLVRPDTTPPVSPRITSTTRRQNNKSYPQAGSDTAPLRITLPKNKHFRRSDLIRTPPYHSCISAGQARVPSTPYVVGGRGHASRGLDGSLRITQKVIHNPNPNTQKDTTMPKLFPANSTRLHTKTCPRCNQPTLTGLDHPRLALTITLNHTPLQDLNTAIAAYALGYTIAEVTGNHPLNYTIWRTWTPNIDKPAPELHTYLERQPRRLYFIKHTHPQPNLPHQPQEHDLFTI